ncbi:hypothetical protein AB9P05_00950 [Roseivirga sp. BDSF3-8]|uniref:hypothetical protein n=1 Tax=Roseivirga sp. BDSF3-8 TaxID=3241598 RepID=UPI003531B6B0
MKKPILLQKRELIKPISQAISRIEKIIEKTGALDSIVLEGLFALGVSSFENSLSDTLKILFYYIPDKLNIKDESIPKQQLLNGNPLVYTIEKKVTSITYKSLEEVLTCFCKAADIDSEIIDDNDINHLKEIKATRNLLLHNNLIVNSFYLATAGPNKREAQSNKRLNISQEYLLMSLNTLKKILELYENELSIKYSKYTKVNAIKKLFKYIFPTEIMKFDNEFDIDEKRDVISSIKSKTSKKKHLSSSERFYYDLWISHTHGHEFKIKPGQFFMLDDSDKLSFLFQHINLLKT